MTRYRLELRDPNGELLVGRVGPDPAVLSVAAARLGETVGDHTWHLIDETTGARIDAGPGVGWRRDLIPGDRVTYQERDMERVLVGDGIVIDAGGWRTGAALPHIEIALDAVMIDGAWLTLGAPMRVFPPITVSADPARSPCVTLITMELIR